MREFVRYTIALMLTAIVGWMPLDVWAACNLPATALEWTSSGSYTLEAPDDILTKINDAVNTIPRVSISLESASVTAEKLARDCCQNDTVVTDGERKAQASVSASADVDVTIWGDSVEYEFDLGWWGVEMELTAELRAEGSVTVNIASGYRWNDCKSQECAFGSFSGSPTIGFAAEISSKLCTSFLWGAWESCAQAGAIVAVYSDWSFDLTYNNNTCSDGMQGSGSLDRLYLKFTASRDGEEDSEELEIYPGS